MSQIAERIALVAVSGLITLIGAELVVRALALTPARYLRHQHWESSDKRFALDAYPDNRDGFFPLDLRHQATQRELHGYGLHNARELAQQTPHAVSLRFSEELCRGAPIAAPDPEIKRILLIGDSFTEAQGVREEQTFPVLVQARHPRWLLMNCARRGYDFPRLSDWMDQHMHLAPDLVVYAMVLNDPEQSEAFRAQQRFLNDWIVDRRSTVEHLESLSPWTLRLPLLLRDRLDALQVGAETTRWYNDMVGAKNREGWHRTLAHLEHMHRNAEAHGAAFLVVLWPLFTQLENYPFAETHETIVRDVRARGVHIEDTLQAFRGQHADALWVHPMDHHPNPIAQRIFAEAIAPTLAQALHD